MTQTDWDSEAVEPVLRVLHQAGIAVNAAVVAANLGAVGAGRPSTAEVAAALAELEDANYVRTLGDTDDYYLITDRGSGHVSNELDAEGFGFVD
ncbi:hypothetical protein [Halobacterium bonnevillei]|uniref:Uncharacterized protein n=1 Tax=Halobacterium bonnevillei TaxID=2692200 RepID=A0A6B0SIN1_9EURY|nr:hypothetical protein [Halobacterium bonnevillei]MXR20987.1 hypothetical protein [Halobacterium bonnevillei]